ncbi:MAG TPA: proton-conducting transporter membrane subunit, partial [Thermoanaerobaculia bacterium]|nr:proton-conducting transporter membrane subunit [Thermoanaerobaculia bacterium]
MAHAEHHGGGAPGWIGWLAGLLPLGLFVWFLTMVPAVAAGGRYVFSAVWIEALAYRFTLEIDGLALLFTILISGIGFLIFGYAGHYLHGHPHLGRCYVYLTGFMISMLGLVAAGDLITLFIFWELTSITSYLLIGLDHARKSARDAALQALLVTGGGGLALLVGFLLLGQVAGTFELSELAVMGAQVQASALYVPILVLILLGAFTKSAQVPFHFWLPNAMEAPTPVSAYLHSATMVKAGVYLLARLSTVLSGREEWVWIVTT